MAEILHVTTVRSLSCNRRGGIGKARRFPSSDVVRVRPAFSSLDEIERRFERMLLVEDRAERRCIRSKNSKSFVFEQIDS